ncbi:hypothetical protein ACR77J_07675 [Tissierella praeacuta]|uniref:hypothetical protein n=1 Tax=Tissierella praeacuta TaxID=43131 RepID=UPI003DA59FDC
MLRGIDNSIDLPNIKLGYVLKERGVLGMDNKYVCPKCDSQLKVYEEYLFQKEKTIDIKTGKPNKKITHTKPERVDLPIGLQCTKCDFIYSGYHLVSNETPSTSYDYLNELIEDLEITCDFFYDE